MPDRTIPPAIHHAIDFDIVLPPADIFWLDNGIKVYALNAGEEEVIKLEMVFAAGNCYEPRNMVAAATNGLIQNGTTQYSAYEIQEKFDYYGAYLQGKCHNETATLSLFSLTKHLPVLLSTLTELLTDSQYPQSELDIYIQQIKQWLAVNLLKCEFVANRKMDALLYGENHPYGRYTRQEDLDALDRDALLLYFNQHYYQGKVVLFVAGKLPSNLAEQLNNSFGQMPWKGYNPSPVDTPEMPPIPGDEQRVHRIVNDPNGVQGAIRLARRFPNRHHPDYADAIILNTLFGGFFGSRLMSNIREEKGYTYGIYSFLHSHIEQNAWGVSTEVGRDFCEAAIREVYHEMERLHSGYIDEEELLLVRNYMLGTQLSRIDGPFEIISRYKFYHLHGFQHPQQEFQKVIENIKTVSASRLQQLAQQYLRPEDFYELVVI